MAQLEHNIHFYIGQPNTGKSHDFKKEILIKQLTHRNGSFPVYKGVKYEPVSVSGGEGNEFRGLQSSDLAISFDPVNNQILFGSLLKSIMKAISEPEKAHVFFLDDFHNQNISSLLSEFTPLLKTQNMFNNYNTYIDPIHKIKKRKKFEKLFNDEFISIEELIFLWNEFIDFMDKSYRLSVNSTKRNPENYSIIAISNKISGQSIKLLFPDNFFLLGAANFNSKTLNIFSDWQARATIHYKDPLEQYKGWAEKKSSGTDSENNQTKLFKDLNEKVRTFLEEKGFYDFKSVCFGYWGYEAPQDKTKLEAELLNAFALVNTSLKFHHRNEWINDLGKEFISIINQYNTNNTASVVFEEIMKLENTEEQLYKLGLYENSGY